MKKAKHFCSKRFQCKPGVARKFYVEKWTVPSPSNHSGTKITCFDNSEELILLPYLNEFRCLYSLSLNVFSVTPV